ncbi:MAG: aldose 1-epimerase family protein [Armatimonadota bacterium]|nr:aldose 1-epimerase family protein [bacterium]
MPILWGKKYKKQELLDRVGDIFQIGGVRKVILADGPHQGVEAVEFRTGSGFTFFAVPGRGLDITIAQHNGRSLSWRSAAGEMTPALYEEQGIGWLRSFPGGLVATCGLTYLGAPCEDMGEKLGAHGRYSNTPASNVYVDGEWDGDDYIMWAMGKVRESRLFGENILLKRRVSAVLGENKFQIHDTVTNEGPRRSPHMLLYHINGGFPAVDEGSLFVSPTMNAAPRDADAEVDKEHFYRMDAPTNGFAERCYYHDMAADLDGWVYAALINKNMPAGEQFGFYVKYNKNELPKFIQWKMNGTREYVVGMEPANCLVEGRDKDRQRGILQFLKPGETREYHLEIGVLANADDVAQFEEIVAKIKG